jgi:Flp pilus assembly protein TadD
MSGESNQRLERRCVMFPVRHIHTRAEEAIKWAAIIALAAALALSVISRSGGAVPTAADDAPEQLPVAMDTWAQPMPQPAKGEPPKPTTATPQRDATDVDYSIEQPLARSLKLWTILMDQRDGRTEDAVEGWTKVRLPAETAVWWHVGLAAAYLDSGRIAEAADVLLAAREIEPNHPVVHYYMGVLRLEQAANASEWNDAVGPGRVRLAAYNLYGVYPNTRTMYRLAAIEELDQAILYAGDVVRGESLVSAYDDTPRPVGPTVDDLLNVIGADKFVANSHSMLGELMIDRGALEQAEAHMDEAVELGIHFPYAYEELGRQYRSVDRHGDAVRAYAKAVQQGQLGGDVIGPTKQMIRSLRDAVTEGW